MYERVILLQMHLELFDRALKLLNDDCFLQITNTPDHMMKERAALGIRIEKNLNKLIKNY